MAIPRLRSFTGPAILSYGFRPFFLLGALFAGGSILFWLPVYTGHAEPMTAFAPVDWHIHEMLFGYVPAIVTGFLPTSWNESIGRFFPARAGMAVFNVLPDPASLAPWAGFAVLVGYAALALTVGGVLLVRRDA